MRHRLVGAHPSRCGSAKRHGASGAGDWSGSGAVGSGEAMLHGESLDVARIESGVEAGLSAHLAGYRVGPHAHVQHVLSVVLAGRLQWYGPAGGAAVGRGGCILTPAGVIHEERFGVDAGEARLFNVLMESVWLSAHGLHFETRSWVGHHQSEATLASRLYHEAREQRTGWRLAAKGYLLSILACLARIPPEVQGPPSSLTSELLEIGRERFHAPPTLAELSDLLGVSSSEICRVFKRDTGDTFGEYVRRLRACRARRLLGERGRSLRRIGEMCGYADQSHFTHQFKAHFGITPGRFREDVRKLSSLRRDGNRGDPGRREGPPPPREGR